MKPKKYPYYLIPFETYRKKFRNGKGISRTRLYNLIKENKVDSVCIGRARFIRDNEKSRSYKPII